MYVKVLVNAGAKKELVKKKKPDSFVVSVKELAKQNEANRRIVEIIAEEFQVPIKQVRIISGHHLFLNC